MLQFPAINELTVQLNHHPLYSEVRTLSDLRLFMEHHVYSVWDFMSLLKCLQNWIAPTQIPWRPVNTPAVRFFINQIVLGEESDEGIPDANGNTTYTSHFELYCAAMREIGADPSTVLHFVDVVAHQGINAAFSLGIAPPPAQDFMQTTFGFIQSNEPYIVGAAFAFGREHIIPAMFRALLAQMNITSQDAPSFHYYLARHIHLDEDFHAPLSSKMVEELIGGDPIKFHAAENAAQTAITARLQFWDGVAQQLKIARNLSHIQ